MTVMRDLKYLCEIWVVLPWSLNSEQCWTVVKVRLCEIALTRSLVSVVVEFVLHVVRNGFLKRELCTGIVVLKWSFLLEGVHDSYQPQSLLLSLLSLSSFVVLGCWRWSMRWIGVWVNRRNTIPFSLNQSLPRLTIYPSIVDKLREMLLTEWEKYS